MREQWLTDDSNNSTPHLLTNEIMKARLSELFEENGIDESTIPKGLDISETEWFFLLNGNHNIDTVTLIKVSEFFDVSLDWLVKGSEHGVVYSGDLTIDEVNLLNQFKKLDTDEKILVEQIIGKFIK